MSQIITLTTAEGFDLKCEITQVKCVTQSLRFFDIPNPDQVDYWRSYFEDFTQSYTKYLLSHTTNLTMKTSCTGIYIIYISFPSEDNVFKLYIGTWCFGDDYSGYSGFTNCKRQHFYRVSAYIIPVEPK